MTSVALERSDRPLVRALEADEPAYAQPVHRGSPELLRVALSYVRSSAVTERVVQKAWPAVPRAIRHFEERASLKTRTFRITVDVTEPRRARREARSLPIFALVEEPSVDGGTPRRRPLAQRTDQPRPARTARRSPMRRGNDRGIASAAAAGDHPR